MAEQRRLTKCGCPVGCVPCRTITRAALEFVRAQQVFGAEASRGLKVKDTDMVDPDGINSTAAEMKLPDLPYRHQSRLNGAYDVAQNDKSDH